MKESAIQQLQSRSRTSHSRTSRSRTSRSNDNGKNRSKTSGKSNDNAKTIGNVSDSSKGNNICNGNSSGSDKINGNVTVKHRRVAESSLIDEKMSQNDIQSSIADRATVQASSLTAQSLHRQVDESRLGKVGRYIAMDCEMVGIGPNGRESALARVSIINFYGRIVLDEYVKPLEPVTNFRTWVSGIRPKDLATGALEFADAQARVAAIIKDRILIGHALEHDLRALLLSHPRDLIRDTARLPEFRAGCTGMPSLKRLAKEILNRDIQTGEHSSVQDALACMDIYKMYKNRIEAWAAKSRAKKQAKIAKKTRKKGLVTSYSSG